MVLAVSPSALINAERCQNKRKKADYQILFSYANVDLLASNTVTKIRSCRSTVQSADSTTARACMVHHHHHQFEREQILSALTRGRKLTNSDAICVHLMAVTAGNDVSQLK